MWLLAKTVFLCGCCWQRGLRWNCDFFLALLWGALIFNEAGVISMSLELVDSDFFEFR